MEKKICVRCEKESDNKLPLCYGCRNSFPDFNALTEYLNSFKGSKEDLLWIIEAEIADRQSSIISHVNVINDFTRGIIELVPIEPSSSTRKEKPWLWNKYEHILQIIHEIVRLKKAYRIAVQYYDNT